jgi:hypothetical protein
LELGGALRFRLEALFSWQQIMSRTKAFFIHFFSVYTFAIGLYVFTYFSMGTVSRSLKIYFLDLPSFFYFYLSNLIHGRPVYSHYFISLTLIIYFYLITIPIYFSIRRKKTSYLWLQMAILLLHFVVTIYVWY